MSQDTLSNNKRIAKNTFALYFRTSITMIVGLYTGRVMLQALGIDNYGINAVVGGIVAMSSLITSTMSDAITRYITYAIGTGNKEQSKNMFSTVINAQIVMAMIATVVLEIVGLWFLNTQASIPEGRLFAANWVLQCGIISLAISLISSPFTATIISHEKMGVYAYTSIVDAFFRLSICFAIMAYRGDRLILFAVLQVIVAIIMQSFYGWFCSRYFEEAHYSFKKINKNLLKELTVFSGWNLINNSAAVFATQGVSMLVNVFFGVTYNAARGIAITVNNAVQGFVASFSIAFTPQITKSYAAGEKEYAVHLGNQGTRFTWLMMYIFIVPVCVEADTLLKIWLGDVPEMAALFLRFAMFESLSVTSGKNLYRLIQADGHVKNYTIHAAITAGLIFPLAWLAYIGGAPVWTSYFIFILVFFVLNIVRFYDLKRLMTFSIRQHLSECIVPCIIVSVVSFIVPMIVAYFMEQGFIRFIINVPISVLWTGICCITFGLTQSERLFLLNKIKKITVRVKK